jgi:hypothetical protein
MPCMRELRRPTITQAGLGTGHGPNPDVLIMRVVIAGSRSIKAFGVVERAILSSPFSGRITEVVSGTARGVDKLGERWAKENNIPIKFFPANWFEYGKGAGRLRNSEMAMYADALIAVWDGESRGTRNMIEEMQRLGKLIFIYP